MNKYQAIKPTYHRIRNNYQSIYPKYHKALANDKLQFTLRFILFSIKHCHK